MKFRTALLMVFAAAAVPAFAQTGSNDVAFSVGTETGRLVKVGGMLEQLVGFNLSLPLVACSIPGSSQLAVYAAGSDSNSALGAETIARLRFKNAFYTLAAYSVNSPDIGELTAFQRNLPENMKLDCSRSAVSQLDRMDEILKSMASRFPTGTTLENFPNRSLISGKTMKVSCFETTVSGANAFLQRYSKEPIAGTPSYARLYDHYQFEPYCRRSN